MCQIHETSSPKRMWLRAVLPAETPPPDLARCDLCAHRSFNLFHPLSAISILVGLHRVVRRGPKAFY